MPRINCDSLQEGMVVARDVKNIDGMLLIPAGCKLAERQIDILQAWGVAEIEVEAGEGAEADSNPLAKLPPEVLAKMTADLKALFWKPDETSPVYNDIFKLLIERRARRGAAK